MERGELALRVITALQALTALRGIVEVEGLQPPTNKPTTTAMGRSLTSALIPDFVVGFVVGLEVGRTVENTSLGLARCALRAATMRVNRVNISTPPVRTGSSRVLGSAAWCSTQAAFIATTRAEPERTCAPRWHGVVTPCNRTDSNAGNPQGVS